MTEYRIIEIPDITDQELNRLIDTLPEWRRKEALAFRHKSGRTACCMAYLLLCEMLGLLTGSPEQPSFCKGPHGKPFIADGPAHISFNLSHCRNAIACIVSDSAEVGIDVESTGRYNERLTRYSMNTRETEYILGCDNPDLAFTLLWTRKEALLKMTGEGINDGLRDVLETDRTRGVDFSSGTDSQGRFAWTTAVREKSGANSPRP